MEGKDNRHKAKFNFVSAENIASREGLRAGSLISQHFRHMLLCSPLLACWTVWGKVQTFRNRRAFMASHLALFCIHWSTKSINAAVPSSGLQEEWQRRSTWSLIPPNITSVGLYLPAPADNLLPHVQFRAQNIDKIQTIFSNQKKLHTPSSPAVLTE